MHLQEEHSYEHTPTQTMMPMNKTRRVTRGTKRNGDHYDTTTSYRKQSNIYSDTREDERRHSEYNRRHGKIFADDNDSVEEMEKTTKAAGDEDMERNHVEYNEEEDMAEGDRTARKSTSQTVEHTEEDKTVKTHQDLEDATRSTQNDEDANDTVELESTVEGETVTTRPELEDAQQNEESTNRKSPDVVKQSPRHHDEENDKVSLWRSSLVTITTRLVCFWMMIVFGRFRYSEANGRYFLSFMDRCWSSWL